MDLVFTADFTKNEITLYTNNDSKQIVHLDSNYRFKDPKNDTVYVLYSSVQAMRQHESVANYRDTEVTIISAIRYDVAQEFIQLVSNLTHPYFTMLPVNATFRESLSRLRDMLLTMHRLEFPQGTGDAQERAGQIIVEIVNGLLENLDYDQFKAAINNSDMINIKYDIIRDNCTGEVLNAFHVLSELTRNIYRFTSFEEQFLKYYTLNNYIFSMLSVLRLVLIDSSIPEYGGYADTQTLLMHALVSMFYDMVVDRSTFELYIRPLYTNKVFNTKAYELMQYFNIKYPILKHITNREELNKVFNHTDMIEEMRSHPINIFPYFLTLRMDDKSRILYIYSTILSMLNEKDNADYIKKICNLDNENMNFISPNELWNEILVPLAEDMKPRRSEGIGGSLPKHYNQQLFLDKFQIFMRIVKNNTSMLSS